MREALNWFAQCFTPKTVELNALKRENEDLRETVEKFQHDHAMYYSEGSQSFAVSGATPTEFEKKLQEIKSCMDNFWNVLSDSNDENDIKSFILIEYETVYYSKSHWKYQFQAELFQILFRDFENESFSCGGSTPYFRSSERARKCWERLQNNVSKKKLNDCTSQSDFNEVVNSRLKNFESHISTELRHALESDPLKIKLRTLVKLIVELHFLAFAFDPPARIVRVRRSAPIDLEFMEEIDCELPDDLLQKSTVAFMIRPGFQIRKSNFKALVYLQLPVK